MTASDQTDTPEVNSVVINAGEPLFDPLLEQVKEHLKLMRKVSVPFLSDSELSDILTVMRGTPQPPQDAIVLTEHLTITPFSDHSRTTVLGFLAWFDDDPPVFSACASKREKQS